SLKLELPESTTQRELLRRVEELNRDSSIHGILVQSPPPEHIDEVAIVRALDPRQDVDGFHPENVAKLVLDDSSGFVPCTPLGGRCRICRNVENGQRDHSSAERRRTDDYCDVDGKHGKSGSAIWQGRLT